MDTSTVNIPKTRYIELLENENRLLRGQLKFIEEGCALTEITKKIQSTGKTLKQWADSHGFDYHATRKVACGQSRHKNIVSALAEQGFLP